MQRRPLGSTGLQVSPIGFGGSPIGSVFRPVTQDVANAAVRAALDAGINYFDTAPYYGGTRAETALGQALIGIPRDQYVLATKVGRYTPGMEGFDFSADRVVLSVDESLSRLRCEQIDVIQVHDMEYGSLELIWNETLPALDRLRSSGKIRFVGITGLPISTLQRVHARAKGIVDTVLSYCHGTLNDSTFLPYAGELRRAGVGTINAAPLAMGVLTRNVLPPWHPAPQVLRDACARAFHFCTREGVSLPDLAMQFSFGLPNIDCTLVGLASPEEVRRAVACLNQKADPEILAGVRALLKPVQGLSWPSGRPESS